MKKTNFVSYWENLKSQNGTINACLVDFINRVNMVQEDDFTKFCKSLFEGKSNKEINALCYSNIKTACKYGEQYTRTIKGAVYTYTHKCSVWDVYKHFYNLYKNSNK